ncbi:hypothetical protein SAMN05443287_101528 [Micromonospora phaseoli]|uniref:Uncharacterized protein n=1 Tax=Micromonospora phaseoli TaxID=1144548 RepID=A0A1H6SFM1_9ACTN|nr:hypothetical protein CLV64_101528 [Micromonospora phaseoli]GIJ79073.1 hypothetical protein Xph01_35050 [Micromonospora phaseoli]SEI62232.1 hypothetical protein SAMN05443287_101528 [Micromonospora phaseoli]
MTLTIKGSRHITVDGVAFRWSVRRRPTYCQANGWSPLTFVVEQAEQPGALLVASLPCAHPGNWFGLPSQPVLPAMVALGVRQALAASWRPSRPGPAFKIFLHDSSPAW